MIILVDNVLFNGRILYLNLADVSSGHGSPFA